MKRRRFIKAEMEKFNSYLRLFTGELEDEEEIEDPEIENKDLEIFN